MSTINVTVSQLNRYVAAVLREDEALSSIAVSGEISNFIRNNRSGHCYFTLKDSECSVKTVMFAGNASKLSFTPENGMKVIACGYVSLYERDGAFQLYVTAMLEDGTGGLYAAFEALKARLSEEGLFADEQKKLIPRYPSLIGIVTSSSGAALRDIVNVLSRRRPLAQTRLFPAAVQGSDAPKSLISALDAAEAAHCDVIIVARGGGSFEDLNCFNDEALARRIHSLEIPVISAVGHETDFTICDFVADLRAPTPSAGAELCAASAEEQLAELDAREAAMKTIIYSRMNNLKSELQRRAERLELLSPENRLDQLRQRIDAAADRISSLTEQSFANARDTLLAKEKLLSTLNPLDILARGYSITIAADGRAVTSAAQLSVGEKIRIRLSDGSVTAIVGSSEE